MQVSTFEGIVENGLIRLRDRVSLPEQTKVFVVIPEWNAVATAHLRSPRLAHPGQARVFQKQVLEAPADASR